MFAFLRVPSPLDRAKVAAKAKDISKKMTEIYKRGTVQANRFPFLNLVMSESVWSTEN